MRQVQQIMGMPISIDIPNCHSPQTFSWVFARLRQIDEKFSTYKKDSEVSRYIKGEISDLDLSPELKNIIRTCRAVQKKTDGYFSAWANGVFDPSGYVKSWAIAEAGEIIERQGIMTYCIGAGGDILARSDSDKIWNIGIQDPANKTEILNKLSISNGAAATSGSYERGSHIINPKTKKPAAELLSVSVAGPDIIWADVLATAVFAKGQADSSLIKKHPGYEALIIDKSNLAYSSPGWPSHNPGSNR
jgi:FAD:protein FMN transferase